jgi:hypothetical protein
MAAAVAAFWSASIVPAFAEGVAGTWAGPWYRGMTSGTMTLRIEPDGSGVIQMNNLDNFPEDEVTLTDTEKGDSTFNFRAPGEGAGVFVVKTQLAAEGTVLAGSGRYEGFAIKFKLKRR